MWHISIPVYLSGGIETNPRPLANYSQGFKICHNCLPTDNYVKIPHLEAYAISHNIDIICLSETVLDTSYSNDDKTIFEWVFFNTCWSSQNSKTRMSLHLL